MNPPTTHPWRQSGAGMPDISWAPPQSTHSVDQNSLPTQVDLYNPYLVSHTIPWENFNFARSTNKIKFFNEISNSGKIYRFNEGPKI